MPPRKAVQHVTVDQKYVSRIDCADGVGVFLNVKISQHKARA